MKNNRLLSLEQSFSRRSKAQAKSYKTLAQSLRAGKKARVKALGGSVNYVVPGIVPAIAQPTPMSCWATVFTMLQSWRSDQSLSIADAVGQVGQYWANVFSDPNTGLSYDDQPQFLADAGLQAEPLMSHSVEGWEQLLRSYGPLWVTTFGGDDENIWSAHARIIKGISGDGTPAGTNFHIIDPDGGRSYQVSVESFLPNFEREARLAGYQPRLQLLHWPQAARSAQNSFNSSSAYGVASQQSRMMTAPAANSQLASVVQDLARQGVSEDEVKAFLRELDPEQRAHSLSQHRARSFNGTTIHLPAGVVLEGWQVQAFLGLLATIPGPLGLWMSALPLIQTLCTRLNITVGIGPAVAAGLGGGGSLGVGLLIAPGNRIGFYGSAAIISGLIDSASASIQLTVVHGGPDVFGGDAVALGGTVDLSEGPGVGVHALFNTSGQFIGVTGELSMSLGIPAASAIEVFAQYQHTATTMGLSYNAFAMSAPTVDVKLRVFIPAPAVGMAVPVVGDIKAFGGDNRSFGYTGGSSRAEIHAQVRVGLGSTAPAISNLSRIWGQSSEYNPSDVYQPSGKPDWYRELREGAHPTRVETLPLSDDNLNYQIGGSSNFHNIHSYTADATVTHFTVAGALPLLPMSPDINADLNLYLKLENGVLKVRAMGTHDGFPAYELYVNQQRIHHYDPIAAGATPMALMGGAQQDVDSGWVDMGLINTAQSQSYGQHFTQGLPQLA